MGIKASHLLMSAILSLWATTALAAEIHGRSSTQFGWFNDIFTGDKKAEFGEYLNLSVTKVDTAGKLSFQGYGRVTQDISNGEEINGRLYYLYGEYNNLFDRVDMRLGRQFVNYAAGTVLIDGGRIDLKNAGPVAFSVMGGRNVFFDLNGEATRSRDFAFGAAAYLQGFKSTDAEVSYFMKLDKDGVARDQIGGSFKQYFDAFKVYANSRYDIPSETFNELLTGIKYFPTANLVLTGEWYQSYPTFDSTSIYAVFAVDRYQEFIGRVDYTLSEKLSINAGYNKQFYGDSNTAADVVEIGCRIHPADKLQVNLNYDHRNGYGGNMNGGIAEVIYAPTKLLELATGLHFDVYERDRVTGEETARKYWVGGKYRLTQQMTASVRIEDNVNARFANDWQGRAVFNYDF